MSLIDPDHRPDPADNAPDDPSKPPIVVPGIGPVREEGITVLSAQFDRSGSGRIGRRGHPIIAWIIICAIVSLIVAKPFGEVPAEQDGRSGEASIADRVIEIRAKYFVGASHLMPAGAEEFFEHTDSFNQGPLEHRFRSIVLTGELAGPEKALSQLDQLRGRIASSGKKLTKKESRTESLLRHLYMDYQRNRWDAPSLDQEQREFLTSRLGWFGRLALAPEDGPNKAARNAVIAPAQRTVVMVVIAMMLMILIGAAGFIGLVVFAAQMASGTLRPRMIAGSRHGAIYAETFAVWLLLFLAMEILASLIVNEDNMLLVNLGVFFLSLLALGWPVMRGVPWRRVRWEIGLTLGKHPFWEPIWGAVCYASTLPLLMVGLVVVMLLMNAAALLTDNGQGGESPDEFAAADLPSHPVIQWISDADWTGRLMIVLLACVAAPIVEEIIFRGVLYRHLRDYTAAWRIALSVVFSAGLASFIFAVIHPQGIIAVPALMSLAFGFSLAREWRGSLIAPMTMHAINNALVTLLMFAIV